MKNITTDTKITFFNAKFGEDEWGQAYEVFLCCYGIHFKLNIWSHGDYEHGSEGMKLVVIERCNRRCEEDYHKLASLIQIWKESCGDNEGYEKKIAINQILEDLPKMIKNFFEKGIIGESSIEKRFDSYFPEESVRP